MELKQRLVWHLSLVAGLIVAVFVCMALAILALDSREEGMVLGLFAGLLLSQFAFAFRFYEGHWVARLVFACIVFVAASLATFAGNFLGEALRSTMYGLWAVVIPYVVVTVGAWESVHRRQRNRRG